MQLFIALALFEGCPFDFLNSPAALRGALEAAVAAGSFTLLEMVVVPFSPQGITACAVVGESHVALHSWPESGRLFVDIASCSTLESVRRAVTAIGSTLPEGRLATLDERIVDPGGARSP
ncbi:S-adenosylmethionine decarboxylase [Sorangium sp. So ce1335]|uniref:S-adenosylmethionine decarboxylase n=1 Tax=Sorangium sp. So ce1335 TaxID=3133335 RepID=UPI003F63CA76